MLCTPKPFTSDDPGQIEAAASGLRRGKLVAFATETVYGLGADATNGEAVAQVFEVKGRPSFNPLIVHVVSLDAACRLGVFDARATALGARFWPGPLTLVVRQRQNTGVHELVTAGLDTIAIRVPGHPVAQALLAAFGGAVAAPSANRSGRVSPTTAAHVRDDLGDDIAMIVDGGAATVGIESTIVAVIPGEPVRVLRPGGISAAELEQAIGEQFDETPAPSPVARPLSPGQLASHYAPRAQVRLGGEPGCNEALLAFGPLPRDFSGPAVTLSATRDLREAAANLFAALRALDATGVTAIVVQPVPEEGLGIAINDRLRRAAADRTEPVT